MDCNGERIFRRHFFHISPDPNGNDLHFLLNQVTYFEFVWLHLAALSCHFANAKARPRLKDMERGNCNGRQSFNTKCCIWVSKKLSNCAAQVNINFNSDYWLRHRTHSTRSIHRLFSGTIEKSFRFVFDFNVELYKQHFNICVPNRTPSNTQSERRLSLSDSIIHRQFSNRHNMNIHSMPSGHK